MGVASLVLGIISVIIAFIPLCGSIAFIPAVVGLILGIIDTVKKSKAKEKKGISIAGLVLSALAIIFIYAWIFLIGASASKIANEIDFNEINSSLSVNYSIDDDYTF